MTAKAKLQTRHLGIGDEIGFSILTNDIDERDYTVWCRISEVVKVDGAIAYKLRFPDGAPKSVPVLRKHVTLFRLAVGKDCACGEAVTTKYSNCPNCDAQWFEF